MTAWGVTSSAEYEALIVRSLVDGDEKVCIFDGAWVVERVTRRGLDGKFVRSYVARNDIAGVSVHATRYPDRLAKSIEAFELGRAEQGRGA